MRDRLIELLGDFPIFHSTMKERWMPEAVERLADHLLAEGVTILPEGAIVLTRAELDALNKYADMVRSATDEQR